MNSESDRIRVGNLCATSPVGMAVLYGDTASFVIEPQWSERPEDDAHVPPGINAPDGSWMQRTFKHEAADVTITWGALLPLIGLEALCDIDDDFNPVPYADTGMTETITVRNVPFGGKLYRIDSGNAEVNIAPEDA